MPCSFYLKKGAVSGSANLMIRARSKPLGVDVRQITPLVVDVKKWRGYEKNPSDNSSLMLSAEGRKTIAYKQEITRRIEEKFHDKIALSPDDVKRIMDDAVTAEIKAEKARLKKEAEEAAAKRKAEEARMTLDKYIIQYIKDVESGARQTEAGRQYAPSTVKSIKQALVQFQEFEKSSRKHYDFNDIDLAFYRNYTAWLRKKGYAINSVGKCIKQLKVIMYTAQVEGYHNNNVWKDKKFKGTRVEVDNIYLTKEDLAAMQAVDMSKMSAGHQLALDIFMVGVWTAQRVSDYNNIHKEDFETVVTKKIVEKEDPGHPGQMIDMVEKREVTVLNVRQQKTGAKVAIPVSSELKKIFEKYNYQIPHLEDQVLNRYIKDVAKLAGLTDPVNIVKTNGGKENIVPTPKYQLVHSHTARRTGATLMYLSGMDVYDICKITGHTSPTMLRKYIKADRLEVVEKLVGKYDYFD